MIDPRSAQQSTGTSERRGVFAVKDLAVQATSDVEIIDEVTFAVQTGEVLALVGESGSGKTTTALALLGHARPGTRVSQGSILLDGVDLRRLDHRVLRKMHGRQLAYVPQDPTASLNPQHRVAAQVSEVLRVHGEGRSRAEEIVHKLFERVDLPTDRSFLRRYPFELSGGQQQRVVIAMALAWRPSLVVLDEPTTGLDVTTQARVLELLHELRKDWGAAFVYVTHDLAVVDGLADRVAVMYAGRIVESGQCDDVFGRPLHPYTSMLLSSVPRLSARLKLRGQNAGAPPPGHRPRGCAFAPRCSRATDRCAEEFPPETVAAEGWTVRCWHPFESREQTLLEIKKPVTAINNVAEPEVVKVRDLVASYGRGFQRHEVLHRVSISLARGQCLALVGQSGSGKSTLGRCVAGLHRPDAGAIFLNGELINSLAARRSPSQRKAIQIVFQNPERSLNPSQRVVDIVGRPLRLFEQISTRDAHGRVADLLDRVRLPAMYLERYPKELSGGEKQRVAIARALAAEPMILISDEITSALDVSTQAAIVELLDSLRSDGLAILFITHNLSLMNSIADHMIVLEAGEIREEGPVDVVLSHPAHMYTSQLLASAPDMRVR